MAEAPIYDGGMVSRLRRLAPALAAVVVLSPLLRAPHSDTYPLSTYPMFTANRGSIHDFVTVVGIDDTGVVVRLSPKLIAGTDEVVLASVTVERAVARGRAEGLCEAVAARTASPITEVVVRSETVDLVAHIVDGAPALAVVEHARCSVTP